jgi:replication factor C subunit 3/5
LFRHVTRSSFFTGTPLQPKDGPKVPESEIIRDTITTETIYNCIAAPPPDAIQQILQKLLNTTDVTSCLHTINTIKVSQGLALADIITALSEQIAMLEVKPEVMILWLDGLAEIEHRIACGGGEEVQTGAVVGVIRGGVELSV